MRVPPRDGHADTCPRRARPLGVELREGDFEFVDNIDGKRTGYRKLVTSAAVMNGNKAG